MGNFLHFTFSTDNISWELFNQDVGKFFILIATDYSIVKFTYGADVSDISPGSNLYSDLWLER